VRRHRPYDAWVAGGTARIARVRRARPACGVSLMEENGSPVAPAVPRAYSSARVITVSIEQQPQPTGSNVV